MALSIGLTDKAETGFGSTCTSAGGTTQSGSTFVIGVITAFARTINTPTDSKSNAYTSVGAALAYGGSNLKLQLFRSENATGGASHTFTSTIDTTDAITAFLVECRGVDTVSVLDTGVTASANDTSSPFTVTSGTGSVADEIRISFIGTNGGGTNAHAESSGFTLQQEEQNGGSFYSGAIATRIVSAVTASAVSWTRTASTDCGLWVIGLRAPNAVFPGLTVETQVNWTAEYAWKPDRADYALASLLSLDELTLVSTPAGAITGAISLALTPSGALTGTGALVGAAALSITPIGALTGTGAMAGAISMAFAPTGALAGIGSMTGAVALSLTASGAMVGTGSMAGAIAMSLAPVGVMSGTGSMVGSIPLAFTPVGALTGTGALVGSATITLALSGALTDGSVGGGAISGTVPMTITVVGALSGTGALSGQVALTFSPVGVLTDSSAPVVETSQRGAGSRTRARRRRHVIRIDGQIFEADSEEQALAILERAQMLAEVSARNKADEIVDRALPKAIALGAVKPIQIKAPVITASPALQAAAEAAQAAIDRAYASESAAAELRLLLALQDQDEEEEWLLLH